MKNSLMTIKPYKHDGVWVFDDERVNLHREPLVAGVPEIIERLCAEKGINDPEDGFVAIFSGLPFPGYHLKITWESEEPFGGNWYTAYDGDMRGWLCPALFNYFDEAPPDIFVEVRSAG